MSIQTDPDKQVSSIQRTSIFKRTSWDI